MFGKKAKKQAELEALARKKAAAEKLAAMRAAESESKVYYESEIILDDVDETDEDEVVEIELVLDAESMKKMTGQDVIPAPAPEEVLELNLEEDEDEAAKEEEQEAVIEEKAEDVVVEKPAPEKQVIEKTTEIIRETSSQVVIIAPPAETKAVEEVPSEVVEEEQSEPEVRYVMDGPTEDEEIVKPAKLAKLPNLVDYMLSLKMSKRMKMMVATLLLGAYAKYKDIPVEKEILIGCMKKLMMALMNEK